MIKHIVLWTFGDRAAGRDKAANVAEVKRRLDECRDLVPGMGAFELTAPQPPLEASFDLLLYSEFADASALRAYVAHPAHQAVVALINEVRVSRMAFDYDPADLRP